MKAALNTPPTVTITSPVSPANINAGDSIHVVVTATDAEGTVKRVDVYANGVYIATDSIAPYKFDAGYIEPGVYKITALATDDLDATKVSDTLTINVIACHASGSITGEGYTNVFGSKVSDLTANQSYPNNPTIVASLPTFEYQNVADNYGGRVRGYICAPVTGDYFFHIAADEQAGLWLSTDENPAHKNLIAYAPSATGFREWFKFGTQTSTKIHLLKGVRYYIETLHKEAGGVDHLSVGWTLPGGVFEGPIQGSRLSPIGSVFPNVAFVSGADAFATAMTQKTIGSSVFSVQGLPNPSTNYFTIIAKGANESPVMIRVLDASGRLVESKLNNSAHTPVQVGRSLRPGLYFIEVTQGQNKERLKMIKQ